MATRDEDAIATQVVNSGDVMDHTIRTTYERQRSLPLWLALARAEDGTYRHEPLATLGDSLALSRQWMSATRVGGGKFDIGPYQIEGISLIEVDAHGQRRWTEILATERLGDAVVALYERHAGLLPDGPGRARAAAIARGVAVLQTLDIDSLSTILAPAIECADHRTLGLGSARGAEVFLRGVRSLIALTGDWAMRVDDILVLRRDALLVRITSSGTDLVGGGTFERPMIQLWTFGADGRLSRTEQFDVDRDAEALARFDALAAAAVTNPRFANAATRSADGFQEAWEARDWDRLGATFRSDFRLIDRRSIVGHLDLDRERHLQSLRIRFEMASSRFTSSPRRPWPRAAIDSRWDGHASNWPIATSARTRPSRCTSPRWTRTASVWRW